MSVVKCDLKNLSKVLEKEIRKDLKQVKFDEAFKKALATAK